MAKNWDLKSVVTLVTDETHNYVDIADVSKRFPIAFNLITRIVSSLTPEGKDAFKEFVNAFPNWLTIRKVETVLKRGIGEVEEDETEEEVEEKPVEKKKEKKAEKPVKAKKAPKKVVEEDDDEDEDDDSDWDL